MRIILNADDFGMCDDTVNGTIECLDAGALSSATLMPTMPGTAKAIDYIHAHPQLSFGVHLTFITDTTEHPVSDPRKIPALLAPNGLFPPSNTVRKMALLGKLPVDQLAIEIEAQIGFVRDQGVEIAHVDSHGHLHKFAPFRAALKQVLPRFGITRVRGVQDIYLRKPLKSPTFWLGPWWRKRLRSQFKTTDHFYMPTSAFENDWQEQILARFDASNPASMEIGVHPGYAEPWRSQEREGIKRFAEMARQRGHQIIGWKEL